MIAVGQHGLPGAEVSSAIAVIFQDSPNGLNVAGLCEVHRGILAYTPQEFFPAPICGVQNACLNVPALATRCLIDNEGRSATWGFSNTVEAY